MIFRGDRFDAVNMGLIFCSYWFVNFRIHFTCPDNLQEISSLLEVYTVKLLVSSWILKFKKKMCDSCSSDSKAFISWHNFHCTHRTRKYCRSKNISCNSYPIHPCTPVVSRLPSKTQLLLWSSKLNFASEVQNNFSSEVQNSTFPLKFKTQLFLWSSKLNFSIEVQNSTFPTKPNIWLFFFF